MNKEMRSNHVGSGEKEIWVLSYLPEREKPSDTGVQESCRSLSLFVAIGADAASNR